MCLTRPKSIKERKAAKEIISEVEFTRFERNARSRRIHLKTCYGVTVRIDLQGITKQDNKTFANVQVQIEKRSVAGAKIRTNVNFHEGINAILQESLEKTKFMVLDIHQQASRSQPDGRPDSAPESARHRRLDRRQVGSPGPETPPGGRPPAGGSSLASHRLASHANGLRLAPRRSARLASRRLASRRAAGGSSLASHRLASHAGGLRLTRRRSAGGSK